MCCSRAPRLVSIHLVFGRFSALCVKVTVALIKSLNFMGKLLCVWAVHFNDANELIIHFWFIYYFSRASKVLLGSQLCDIIEHESIFLLQFFSRHFASLIRSRCLKLREERKVTKKNSCLFCVRAPIRRNGNKIISFWIIEYLHRYRMNHHWMREKKDTNMCSIQRKETMCCDEMRARDNGVTNCQPELPIQTGFSEANESGERASERMT